MWKQQEIQFLKDNYATYGASYCSDKLNKTNHSVWQQANRLGLKYVSKISKLESSKKEIIEAYLNGETPTILAAKYSSDVITVNELFKKYKVLGKNKELRKKRKHGQNSGYWKGHQEISGTFFNQIKRCAAGRKIMFDLDIQYLWELFIKQDRKCALSGTEIYFCKGPYREKINQTASLDRIDSSKGYIKDNVQWVHKNVNHMKWSLPQEEFIEWCRLITENKSSK